MASKNNKNKSEEPSSSLEQIEQKQLQKGIKSVSISGSSSKSIKPLSEKYGLIQKKRGNFLKKRILVKDADINSLFTSIKKEVSKEKAEKIDMRESAVIKSGQGSVTKLANNVDRNIYTEGNELAEQALNNNIIDFSDKRIKVSNQKSSQWKNQIDEDIVQVDLGKVRSLDKSQVLIDHLDFENIPKGAQIVDSKTAKNAEYDLVLVGRKLKEDEIDDISLQEINDENDSKIKHYINKEIFHEADLSDVSKGAKKNEGLFKYYSRNFLQFYIVFILVLAGSIAYNFHFKIDSYYEDYIYYMTYYNFKRGRDMDYVTRITYRWNTYNTN